MQQSIGQLASEALLAPDCDTRSSGDLDCEMALEWWRQSLCRRGVDRGAYVKQGFSALLSSCTDFIANSLVRGALRDLESGASEETVSLAILSNSTADEMVSLLEGVSDFVDFQDEHELLPPTCPEPDQLKQSIEQFLAIQGRWLMEREVHALVWCPR